MMKLLVFDVKGPYAHFKKYYVTTSALSYAIPPKTALYGLVGAILGLSKEGNKYLDYFSDKSCLMGLQLCRPLKTTRVGINLRPDRSRYKDNPKPTLFELISEPHYRIFFHHKDERLQTHLSELIKHHCSVYTPSLGLANLVANVWWQGEVGAVVENSTEAVSINSVIPIRQFVRFGEMEDSNIVSQTMFAIEMDKQRNVTERDDILFDRDGNPIKAVVTQFFKTSAYGNVVLF